ncbi:spondin domain-containing protein [Thalassotalea sp. LPB0316]|uniref:spondin domain-containing protein n=1 Tax=Thalassotalea sp. LPB0316 TaxID=2769490 RepID=UPI00186677C3|nr:spondin domain-containing protein [Thalassotalea sp. LPB0316]QOL25255.1 spondin domain-containing protein [Thalassotalea sp. LPB0316]
MKGKLLTLAATMALSPFSMAQQLEVTVTNLTNGIHYTPLIVAAHDDSVALFSLGQTASAELQAMAEGGDISGLAMALNDASADVVENPAGGLLAPATSTMTSMDTADGNMYLSIAGMMLPTNDGFVALNAWPIPTEAGTYTVYLNAYDAGTEANDEIINGGGAAGTPGIPVAPGGDGGTGATGVTTEEANDMVHIHRGVLGDDNPSGGTSDLDNTVHRWLNPVAKVTVVVM